jgi:hypothetical protein
MNNVCWAHSFYIIAALPFFARQHAALFLTLLSLPQVTAAPFAAVAEFHYFYNFVMRFCNYH